MVILAEGWEVDGRKDPELRFMKLVGEICREMNFEGLRRQLLVGEEMTPVITVDNQNDPRAMVLLHKLAEEGYHVSRTKASTRQLEWTK